MSSAIQKSESNYCCVETQLGTSLRKSSKIVDASIRRDRPICPLIKRMVIEHSVVGRFSSRFSQRSLHCMDRSHLWFVHNHLRPGPQLAAGIDIVFINLLESVHTKGCSHTCCTGIALAILPPKAMRYGEEVAEISNLPGDSCIRSSGILIPFGSDPSNSLSMRT